MGVVLLGLGLECCIECLACLAADCRVHFFGSLSKLHVGCWWFGTGSNLRRGVTWISRHIIVDVGV